MFTVLCLHDFHWWCQMFALNLSSIAFGLPNKVFFFLCFFVFSLGPSPKSLQICFFCFAFLLGAFPKKSPNIVCFVFFVFLQWFFNFPYFGSPKTYGKLMFSCWLIFWDSLHSRCYRYIQDVLKVYARYIQWYSKGIRLELDKGILNGILKAFEIVY